MTLWNGVRLSPQTRNRSGYHFSCLPTILLGLCLILPNSCSTVPENEAASSQPHAFNQLAQAAQSGDRAAQRELGLIYLNGEGVSKNREEGFRWLNKAAQQDDGPALLFLGQELRKRGEYMQALDYYQRSAATGYSEAQYQLALSYLGHTHPKRYHAEALAMLESAASKNHPPSMYLMGIYKIQQGSHMRPAGLRLLERARTAGDKRAAARLALLEGDAKVRERLFMVEHYRRMAEQGDGEAQLELGRLNESGVALPKNDVEAYMWYTLSAEGGTLGAEGRQARLAGKMSDAQMQEAMLLIKVKREQFAKLTKMEKRMPPVPDTSVQPVKKSPTKTSGKPANIPDFSQP